MNNLELLYKHAPLYKDLFDKQLEFALAPSRFRAALCSRRAGKTKGLLIEMFQRHLSKPGTLGVYLALTDRSVVKIVFPIARELILKHKIKASIVGDEIVFENGSIISVLGANHINKIEGFRGTKLLDCVIDEAASFKDHILGYLVDEIIAPALSDLQGPLILVGTPAAHCSGMFHRITMGLEGKDVWVVKKWTAFDNPYMHDQHVMDSAIFLKRKQCDTGNPKYRREYLGEWCTDNEARMIKPFTLMNMPSPYMPGGWRSVIGVDFGFNDETAFSVIGWQYNNPRAYVIECFGYTGGSVSQIAASLVALKAKYQPIRIVGDPAGASKIMMEEFQKKYKVHMEVAQKQNKAHYIEILNDALTNENLVLNPTTTLKLQAEMKTVVWNEERTRELEGPNCDHLDATLYAYREAIAYIEKIKIFKVKTPQEIEQEMMRSQAQRDAERANEKLGDTFFQEMNYILEE